MAGTIKDNASDTDEFDAANFVNEEDEKAKAEILAAFDGSTDNPDDSWMDPNIEEPESDVTSVTEGQRAIERAEDEQRKARKTESQNPEDTGNPDPKEQGGDKKEAKPGDPAPDGEAEGKSDDDGLSDTAIDTLLDGVSDDRKAEITRRFKEADDAMAAFQTPYIKEQMKQFGSSPKQVSERLVDLATFASQKPDEYLAWAAQEMASSPDKVGDVLASAAKMHGYKLVKDDESDDDDDLFLDDETRAILEENKRLKAQIGGGQPSFGPDTPERQSARTVQQQLTGFINEVDETGNLVRPHFNQLQPRISQMAQEEVSRTGKPATVDDLSRFYAAALDEARDAFGAQSAGKQGSAAQGSNHMADQMQKKADAAARARRASKSIGGNGQGAGRQLARASDDESTLDLVKRTAVELGFET